MDPKLEQQMQTAEDVSKNLQEDRLTARSNAVIAIRLIEDRLVEALSGERLRGLPNLNKSAPYFAARVRSKPAQLLEDDRWTLVLDDSGMLMMAAKDCSTAAKDEDLLAEDLEKFTRVVKTALDGHISACTRSAKSYAKCTRLSSLVWDALMNFEAL